MGVNGLYSTINSMCPDCVTTVNLKDLENKIIGIDTNLWLYQIVIATRGALGKDIVNSKGQNITHIVGIINRIAFLKKHKIKPVFIFDGKPPELKYKTIEKRAKLKENANNLLKENTNDLDLFKKSYKLTKSDCNDIKDLLSMYGIPYVDSVGETDSQLGYMYKKRVINYIISEDCDILAFGGNKLIKGFSTKKSVFNLIDMEIFYEQTGWTQRQLCELSVLLGSDYNTGLPHHSPQKILNALSKHGNLKNMMATPKMEKYYGDMVIVVEYYLNPGVKRYLKIRWMPAKHNSLNQVFKHKLEFSDRELKRQLYTVAMRNNKFRKRETNDISSSRACSTH